MEQDRISGIAIIAGALMAVLTMALHPVGGDLREHYDWLVRIAPVARGVHVLGLAAIAVQAFGFLGLYRQLGAGAGARAGLVAYAAAWVAVFGGATLNGLVGPDLIEHYAGLEGAERAAMHVVWDSNGILSRVLDRIWITGTGIGTIAWCASAWRFGGGWKLTGALGVLVSTVGLAGLMAGRFPILVSTVAAFVFGYSLWAVGVGALLCVRRR